MLTAVLEDPRAFEFAAAKLRRDPEFVMAALEKDPRSFEFAADGNLTIKFTCPNQ